MNLLHMCSKGVQKARAQGGEFSEENIEPKQCRFVLYCEHMPVDKKMEKIHQAKMKRIWISK